MPQTLTFYTLEEKPPEHNQEIMILKYSSFYSTIESLWATAYYEWFEYEDGNPTGTQITYDPDSTDIPEGCKLELLIYSDSGSYGIAKDTLWCPACHVDGIVDNVLNPEKIKDNPCI